MGRQQNVRISAVVAPSEAVGSILFGGVFARVILLILGLGWVSGCTGAAQKPLGSWQGPAQPALVSGSPWYFGQTPARQFDTAHYNLYTTMSDDALLSSIIQLMEGAIQQYHRLVPNITLTVRPMETFLFRYRNEWALFTQATAGDDAPIYLRIVRGGYTLNERSVVYFIGDTSTYSVVAHEGFHQFVSRHFASRLPPFLEEGLACMFESVWFVDDLPRWNLSINYNRMNKLRTAVQAGDLWSLPQLLQTHAGEVVDLPPERIEAFYAQNWAFAKFLWQADDARYRPALLALLDDAARGRLPAHLVSSSHEQGFDPRTVQPLLEHYLQMPLNQIDQRFQAYIHVIVTDEYARQGLPKQ